MKERRSKFESILNNQLGVVDKKQRVEMEELRLKSDIKKALDKLKVKTKPLLPGTSSHEGRSFLVAAKCPSRNVRSKKLMDII